MGATEVGVVMGRVPVALGKESNSLGTIILEDLRTVKMNETQLK
jgi:hypothetical protein